MSFILGGINNYCRSDSIIQFWFWDNCDITTENITHEFFQFQFLTNRIEFDGSIFEFSRFKK